MSDEIRDLARNCPSEYPINVDGWENNEGVKALSQALVDAGYSYLSLAVLGGKAWTRRIRDGESLGTLYAEAAQHGWSWNKVSGDE